MNRDEIHMHALGIVPEAIPQPKQARHVPEEMYDAVLRSYAALEAEVAPVYRRAKAAEESRAAWRCVAIGALVALLAIGIAKVIR